MNSTPLQTPLPEKTEISFEVAGKTYTFETGRIARQANGSVCVSCGDTMLFSSACGSKEPVENASFFPLRVDYQEKFSGAGKTLGGFLKREGRPTENHILTSRLIDRPLRPLFPEGFYHEVQLLTYAWSYDGENAPDVMGITASALALHLSDIPFPKALAAVRVGLIDGAFIINPTIAEQATSTLDLILAGTSDALLMIEGYSDFLSEEQMIEAVELGHGAIKTFCSHMDALRAKVGKEKMPFTPDLPSEAVHKALKELVATELSEALLIPAKAERQEVIDAIAAKAYESLEDDSEAFSRRYLSMAFKSLQAELMRGRILAEGVRIDGRSTTDIRPITVDQHPLPRAHGSSLFTRGETQTLAVCTLGSDDMAQRFETIEEDGTHRFYLQYSFPPFSVGEVGRAGPASRREIGHGKLAERALAASIPSREEFPYVIRLESNITESNGSSSQASVCGGCLAMMDAGVPIKRPVAGIAMGLILEGTDYAIISDILGAEDALGDMDLKIAGDKEGITAFQMDIKIEGITSDILRAALAQAKSGRSHILDEMLKSCPSSREDLSEHAPRIRTLKIKQSKVGIVIGPGGKQIREITETTGVEVNIDDSYSDDLAIVSLSSVDSKAMDRAEKWVSDLTSDVEVGEVYTGKIASIVEFGLFVEIFSKQGLCHISELSMERIENMEDTDFKEGAEITVKVLDVTDQGKIRLSHRATLPGGENITYERPPRDPSRDRRGARDDRRGGGRPDRRRRD